MVTITIKSQGPSSTSEVFTLHLDFLVHTSPFFAAAFTGSFSEAESKSMSLEDTTVAAFGIFQNWVYTQSLPPECTVKDLVDAWILSDRVLVPALQDDLVDALDKHPNKAEDLKRLDYEKIWQDTEKDGTLRRFLVTQFANFVTKLPTSHGGEEGNKFTFPVEMMVEIFNSMRRKSAVKQGELSGKIRNTFYVDVEGKDEGKKDEKIEENLPLALVAKKSKEQ